MLKEKDVIDTKENITNFIGKIICGNTIEVLKKMPDECIDMVMFSPPYYGLRNYGTLKWEGGDPNCKHETTNKISDYQGDWDRPSRKEFNKVGILLKCQVCEKDFYGKIKRKFCSTKCLNTLSNEERNNALSELSNTCQKCGAKKIDLQIGLEPTFKEFLDKLIEIMWEVKRVLKPTGTIWINFGDSYGGQPAGNKEISKANVGTDSLYVRKMKQSAGAKSFIPNLATDSERMFSGKSNQSRLKQTTGEKCLLMQPERFAIRCIDELELILRNKIVWCLDEDTSIFCLINDRYNLLKLNELAKFKNQKIKIPAWSKEGIKWKKVKSIWESGEKEIFEIHLKNGKKVLATADHIFPKTVSNVGGKYIKLSFSKVKDLNLKYHKLYVATRLTREKEIVCSKNDYENGLLVGWYLAEGSGIHNPKICCAKLTVGKKDLIKIDSLTRRFNLKVKKQKNCNAYDIFFRGKYDEPTQLVKKYILGRNAKEKYFSDNIWNVSLEFLKGVLEGFLEGDGNYDKINKRWRVRIAFNLYLVQQIETICLLLGKQFRKENSQFAKGFDKLYPISSFSIQDWNKRIVNKEISYQAIRSIKSIDVHKTYDLEIEPIYLTRHKIGPTINKKLDKWNNIYFLGNGILTHNCKQILKFNKDGSKYTIGSVMPSSVKSRFNESWEYLYFFVKNNKTILWRNKITKEWVDKKPFGIEGIEGKDWEWRECYNEKPDCKKCNGTGIKKVSLWEGYSYWCDLDSVRLPHSEVLWQRLQYPFNPSKSDVQGAVKYTGVRAFQKRMLGKDYFNYRVRDAKRKAGQPQYKVSEEEITKYQQEKLKFYPQEQAGHIKSGGINSPEGKRKYWEKLYQNEEKITSQIARKYGYEPEELCSVCGRSWKRHASPNASDRKTGIRREFIPCINIEEYKRETGKIKGGGANLNLPWNPITGGKIFKIGKHPDYTHSKRFKPGEYQDKFVDTPAEPLGKNICSVWQINPEPHNFSRELGLEGIEHFAHFPEALCSIPILFGSPPGGIILDPFCGSGTTLLVSEKLGRKWIGIELNEDYCKLGQKRIAKWRKEENDGLFADKIDINPPPIITEIGGKK